MEKIGKKQGHNREIIKVKSDGKHREIIGKPQGNDTKKVGKSSGKNKEIIGKK